MNTITFGSVCSGIEAASVAWHALGWRAAWLAEIENFPSSLLAHHYPDVPNHGDMTALPAAILGRRVEAPDVFCGGTPCQAFSVAGKRRSLDDARGNLSLTFCEIANAIDTVRRANSDNECVVFWENVPGVLSTKDNAFGCFLAGLAGEDEPLVAPGGRWANAGLVLGPARAVAWRVFDAQYFGVAQRRRRVFVVASARNDFDPAAVLFEFEGLRRDTAPSREAQEATAGGAGAGVEGGSWWDGGQVSQTLDAVLQKGQTMPEKNRFPAVLQPAKAPRSSDGGVDREDGHTLVVAVTGDITHALNTANNGKGSSEDGTGRGVPTVAYTIRADAMREGTAKTPSPDAEGRVRLRDPGLGIYTDVAPTLDCGQAHGVAQVGAFAQNSRDEVRLMGGDGGIVGAISAEPGMKQTCYVAFTAKDHGADAGEIAPTLRAMGHSGSHANAGGQVAVAFTTEQTPKFNDNCALTLTKQSPTGGGQVQSVMTDMRVRRLTPAECEALQGFPRGHTDVPHRGKPAADGPRYKAIGNSWAVPCVRWIGRRIDRQLRAANDNAALTVPPADGVYSSSQPAEDPMPKKTVKQVRADMVEHIDRMVKYWAAHPGLSIEDRCDGVAFSVLTMLDGAASLPRFSLAVVTDPEDPEYQDGLAINDDVDLHDIYTALRREQGK